MPGVELLLDGLQHMIEFINSLSVGWLIFAAAVLITLYYWPIWNLHKYPRCVFPYPFIGNGNLVYSGNYMQYFADNKDKYGKIFTLQLEIPTVFLNDTDYIYDLYVKQGQYVADRPPQRLMPSMQVTHGRGVAHENSPKWQALRKHLLAAFREQGVGKEPVEEYIMIELDFFVKTLLDLKGEPIFMKSTFRQATSNIVSRLVIGARADYSQEMLKRLRFDLLMNKSVAALNVPFMRFVPGDPWEFHKSRRDALAAVEFVKQEIQDHKKTINRDHPRDVIDYFLIDMERDRGNPDTAFTEDNLLTEMMQLYMAGTNSTAHNLLWMFLYVTIYPEMQQRIYEEIKEVIGAREAVYADRLKMHYTMAYYHECLRKASVFQNLPHYTSKDVYVDGHKIPKHTAVVANLWGTCNDPNVYEDPLKFKPERFLDADGKFVKPDAKLFIPFCIGKRQCVGEGVARVALFLFLVTCLQRFQFVHGQDFQLTDVEERDQHMIPVDFAIKFIPRED